MISVDHELQPDSYQIIHINISSYARKDFDDKHFAVAQNLTSIADNKQRANNIYAYKEAAMESGRLAAESVVQKKERNRARLEIYDC